MTEIPNLTVLRDATPAPSVGSGVAAGGLALLRRFISPLLVFIALGGLWLWGHHTGWTLPRFSSLMGQANDTRDDWCSEHSVPESQCIECNATLLPRPKPCGWCKLHGVHECPLCHPEVAQTAARPEVIAADLARAQRALDAGERPENNSTCKLHERRIQFVSRDAAAKAGIDVEPVWTAPMIEAITGQGEIAFDQTRTARLSARVPGSVFRVEKHAGEQVSPGEVLALVDAAEVGRAKSELLQALVQLRLRTKTFQSLASVARSGAVAERTSREAESALSEARIRLVTAQQALTNLGLPIQPESLETLPEDQLAGHIHFLGLPATLAESLDPKVTTASLLPVIAPFAGVVLAQEAVAGEMVDSSKVLFVVVDVRQMWLSLDLRVEDMKRVALGQEVRFTPDGGREARGKITWISTEADPKTRTIKVRASLDNADGRLRANVFGAGRVILREEAEAIVVPNAAVQQEGCCHVVFVRDKDFFQESAPKVFHVRTVRLGVKDEKQTEIIAGVLPGEVVATKGSASLRAELLKNNLGEGCACCKK